MWRPEFIQAIAGRRVRQLLGTISRTSSGQKEQKCTEFHPLSIGSASPDSHKAHQFCISTKAMFGNEI
jgi:hypothetical protein